ncbi:tobamovirus multiplication protein 1-like protein, partial [Tanacetum coccineum]
ANDEDEDGGFPREPLLEKVTKANLKVRSRRRCCNIRIFPVGSHQQVMILVTLLIFVIMLTSAVLIWIGLGKNPIDSSVVARVEHHHIQFYIYTSYSDNVMIARAFPSQS